MRIPEIPFRGSYVDIHSRVNENRDLSVTVGQRVNIDTSRGLPKICSSSFTTPSGYPFYRYSCRFEEELETLVLDSSPAVAQPDVYRSDMISITATCDYGSSNMRTDYSSPAPVLVPSLHVGRQVC